MSYLIDGKRVEAFGSGQSNKTLYHYTTLETALSIISSGTIFASHIDSMDDGKELDHIFEEIVKVWRNAGYPTVPETRMSTYIQNLKNHMRLYQPFVSSWTSSRDNNLMYRSYGPVSLGISRGRLQRISKNQRLMVQPCLYRPEHKKELIRESYVICQKGLSDPESPSADSLFNMLIRCFDMRALMFKQLNYEGEKEERIHPVYGVEESSLGVKTRLGENDRKIRYIEIELKDGPYPIFDEVIVGPELCFESTAEMLRTAARTSDCRIGKIEPTEMQIRNS